MSPRPAKLGSLNRAVRQINAEVLEWAFAHPSPTRYYIREEGGRYSIRGLCLSALARKFGHVFVRPPVGDLGRPAVGVVWPSPGG